MKHIISTIFATVSLLAVFAQAPTKMTYQAVVRDAGGNLITSSNIGAEFNIYEGSPTGTLVFTETATATTNANGLMTYEIGSSIPLDANWGGNTQFLEVNIDPTGGANYTITSTTELLSVPYSLFAEEAAFATNVLNDNVDDADADPLNEIQSLTQAGSTVSLSNGGGTISVDDNDSDPTNELQTLSIAGSNLTLSNGNTVALPAGGGGNTLDAAYDQGGAGAGRIITVDAGEVEINTATASGIALRASNTNTGVAIIAGTTNAANTFSAIQSASNSNSNIASAIIGNSTGAAWGVSGQVQSGATAAAAVYGSNLRTNGGHGVSGIGFNGTVGETNYSMGYGIYGENYDAIAPLGDGVGVAGRGYYGVFGEDRYLGAVAGAYGVYSNGDLGATGTKTFIIDHPFDPENKFLRHFSTESNEVLNIYRGNALFDQNGEAIVSLPDYYDAINKNPSYNLTPVGGFAQLYVKQELQDGTFVIAGGTPGLKVSWTVYSERNDAYLQTYPDKRAVEVDKRPEQKGNYVMPQLYGQPQAKKIGPVNDRKTAEQPVLNIQER